MTQSTKTTLRVVGTIMWIVGAVAFIAGLFAGGTTADTGKVLVYGGAVLFGVGLIIDSLADGGIFVVFRLIAPKN